MKFWQALLLVFFLGQLAAPPVYADSVDRSYKRAADRFYRLYRPGKFRGSADNWEKTIALFQKIVRQHPGHKRAPQALYNIGKLSHSLYKWNHKQRWLNQGITNYRALVENYPKVRLADDAQFQIAVIYEEYKKKPRQAYLEYQELVRLFPKGDYARIAKRKLRDLPKPHKDEIVAYKKAHYSGRPAGQGAKTRKQIAPPGPVIPTAKHTKAVAAKELTVAHFGGLSEKESAKKSKKSLVKDVEHWSTENWSRMVINIADPVRFKYQVLPGDKKTGKGPRMYLDLPTTYLPKKFKRRITANDGMIKQARIAQFNPKTVRVVLDLVSLERIKVYPFDTPDQYKIIIDILGDEVAPASYTKAPANDVPLDGVAPKSTGVNKITLSEALGLKVHRIIIDPGHGGKDPGASGFGIREKNLALQIGKRLRNLIKKKNPEIEVLMTRDTDRYLKLEARTAFANKHQGDLFISIHLNASRRSNVSGMETYYLNLTTDSYALTLAAKENQTSLRSISNLQGLLHDLMTHSKIQESTQLAHLVQNNAVKEARASKQIRLRNLGVKRAPFFVLLGAQMPSILVEAGFISNKKENKLLQTKQYQQTLAQGMYQGIYRYMDRM